MGTIYRTFDLGPDKVRWRVQFVRTIRGKRERFSGIFLTKGEAKKFHDENELLFVTYGRKAVKYDSDLQRRRRKFGEKRKKSA